MRIVLVVRDQALRIASAVVRALDFADRVTILNLGNNPETTVLAIEAGAGQARLCRRKRQRADQSSEQTDMGTSLFPGTWARGWVLCVCCGVA